MTRRKSSSELRRDAHHGGWVLMAFQPEREQLLNTARREWVRDANHLLTPLEQSGAHVIWSKTARVPSGDQHTVRVLANAFALYRVEGNEDRLGVGMYDQMRGVGAHEIFLESENPHDTLSALSPHQYALTLEAVQARIKDLKNDLRLRAFSWFREWTCGEEAPPLPPHSQLIASAILPLGLLNELDAARSFYQYKERCLFCDMIRQELHDSVRVVCDTEEYLTYCPFASRHHFELHLFPKAHSSDFAQENPTVRPALAAMIRDAAIRFDQAIPGWPVLMVLHNAPVFDPRHEYYHSIHKDFHWHLEFLPQPPGFLDWYSRTGTHVESTPPEAAAEFLRQVSVPSPWG